MTIGSSFKMSKYGCLLLNVLCYLNGSLDTGLINCQEFTVHCLLIF